MAKRKAQTKKAKRINRDLTVVNIIFSVLALVINLMMWWSIFSITRYSSFSKIVFIVINIAVLLLMLTMNYLLFMLIRTKKVTFMNTVSAMLVVFLLVGTFATYATTRINVNVNKITNTGSKNEKVETSLVVYSATGSSSITDINGLDGKTVGYVEGANDGTMALDELTAKNINATTKPYSDYITLAQALFAGEVDCAALPSNYVGLLEVNDGFTEYLDNTKAISTFDKVIKVETEVGSTKDITKDPFTVLILGVDEGRSDAIMVASFNPISLNVTLSSIARDSYVPIACYSGKGSDKIGHARARNRQCTIDTIEDLLDIDIDYYFESNFKGVIEMVDALGGIVVNNPIEFVGQNASTQRGHYTVWVPAGENVPLNGEQALAFARERHKYATGDFQRQANQQQVIQAILRQMMRLRDVNKGLAMVEAAGENISTNMSVDQLISLFNYSMKKAGRYYDKASLENVFNIIGSRVTGYSDGIWNDGLQQNLYIYRLYEGAINDTHDAIIRNTDMNSKITAPKSIKWDATWEFTAPVIANEAYSGEVKIQTIPDNLPKFTTVGKLQAWAKSFGIKVNVQEIGEGMPGYDANLADGTIIEQDVLAGTPAASISVINVKVIKKAAKVTACPTNSTGTYPDCVCTANTDGKTQYDKNSNSCIVPNGKEYTLTVRYTVNEGPGVAPVTHTEKVKEGATYSVVSPSLSGYTPETGTVSGTMPGNNVDVTVKYIKTTTTPTPGCPAGATGKYPDCVCSDANQQYNKDKNVCEAKPENPKITACKASGGEWINNACACPADKVLQGDSCVIKQEDPAITACKSSGGTWGNNACTCPGDKILDGNACRAKTEQEKCSTIWFNNACYLDWSAACSSIGQVVNEGGNGCKASDEGNQPSSPTIRNGNMPQTYSVMSASKNLLDRNSSKLIVNDNLIQTQEN